MLACVEEDIYVTNILDEINRRDKVLRKEDRVDEIEEKMEIFFMGYQSMIEIMSELIRLIDLGMGDDEEKHED